MNQREHEAPHLGQRRDNLTPVRVGVDSQALPLPLRLRSLLDHWKLESSWTVAPLPR